MSGAYVCEACKDEGRDFTVPVDEIGVAVMSQHLETEHGVRVEPR